MAKTKMLCPFSGDLCKNCSVYRGRHYYLCFYGNYRGHLHETGEVSSNPAPPTPWPGLNPKFETPYIKLPHIKPIKAIDPHFIIKREGS
jgi:hypothetical protein